MRTHVLLLVTALSLAACGPKRAGAPRANPNLITMEEIHRVNAATAYDVVSRLRPAYLRNRGPSSITNPVPAEAIVYVDGMRMGGVSQLQRIPAAGIFTISYMSGIDASSRYGLGHEGGAILVATRR